MPDGLYTPEVGEWSDMKYRLVSNYAEMFSTAMKDKWDQRVYIDLFSGAGRGKIKDSKRVVATSPLLAMGVRNPFDRYICCDLDPRCIEALRARVAKQFPHLEKDVIYVAGDCNDTVNEVLDHVRALIGNRKRVLSFCVVDPFTLGNLKFSTIERLASIFVELLSNVVDRSLARRRPFLLGFAPLHSHL